MSKWAETAQEWVVTNGADFVVNVVIFLLILLVGKIVIGMICRITSQALKKNPRVSEMLQTFAGDILRKALWLLVLMIALDRLGIQIGPLIAGLGVAGFVIGFAFQESLGNLAAGVMILLNEPFRIGDFAEAGGHSGTIKDMNLMATTLTTPDNKKIVIPNRSIWGGSITNYTALDTRRVDMTAGISYSSDIAKAKQIVHRILASHDKVLEEPAPVVEVVEMADSSVNLVVRPWAKTSDYWTVYFSLNQTIKETFDREGIVIPFPQVDVHHHGMAATA